MNTKLIKNLKGYWNGEPAQFVGVVYEVPEPEIKTWWLAMFIGQRRQGIQVNYGSQVFVIDNEHGDGYYKVTRGMGSPRIGHKSTGGAQRLFRIPEDEINKIVDKEALKKEDELHDEFLKKNHPESYERSKALREMLNKTKQ